MLKNYFKIAWRNLLKNKTSSFINISGLAVGMAVAILIGLWIYDELSFNKNFKNYDRIAQVGQNATMNNEVGTGFTLPHPMGDELRRSFGNDFKNITMASWNDGHILAFGEKTLMTNGTFFGPSVIDMFSIEILNGSKSALDDPSSIMLSETAAKAYFGDADPIGKMMKMDNAQNLKVTGVYKNFPDNSSFSGTDFIATWEMFATIQGFKYESDQWRCNCYSVFTELNENAEIKKVSAKIKDVKRINANKTELKEKNEVFLFPMSKWHLYSDFKNGMSVGGRIQYVWLFGIIGTFVLLLACINFMNLSTARSEKRAKEVGIRKSVGSLRVQLIFQFFSESLLVAVLAFALSLLLVQLILPFFNNVSGKKISILWNSPLFWLMGIGFSIITGLIAGSYPALYLSSFNPVKVLKGTFKAGRFASVPRKVLVVVQFTVSVILIIGTIVIFQQIQFAKDRPIGYNRNGLVTMSVITDNIHKHFDVIKNELTSNGAVASIAESNSPTTSVWSTNSGFDWKGKDPTQGVEFPNIDVSEDYGKTVGWQIIAGRDFSKDFISDTAAFILNESAAKFIGFKNPIGEIVKWDGEPFKIIGIVKDLITESPYEPIRPTLYHTYTYPGNVITAKLNPLASASQSLKKIEAAFKKYNPSEPFNYKFIDEAYAQKFGNEQRIGKLASFFAVLAIFISCLGLFGMASFIAEQRTKEIGVRKVLGASVFNVWRLLSKEFVMLVIISLLIAIPSAYYFMHNWLQNYQYRTGISWWIFAAAGIGALMITIITVSYQAIKAAVANPVKSLRTE
ncbi:MAG TPA: ABC transporter permease [Puia sp.]|nr:ABC transporter permease [Puia sp.]